MNNLVDCNRGLATMSVEVNVRFLALLSLFDRTQGPVYQGKVMSCHRKNHLDPAAWVLSGEINEMNNLADCNRGLATTPVEVNVRFIALLSPFDRTQGPIH